MPGIYIIERDDCQAYKDWRIAQDEANQENDMPDIQMTPCNSSLIHARGYDAATQTLALQFKAKGGKPGPTYHYAGVPTEMYAELCDSPSIGKFFGERIKNNQDLPYTKIEEPKAEERQA